MKYLALFLALGVAACAPNPNTDCDAPEIAGYKKDGTPFYIEPRILGDEPRCSDVIPSDPEDPTKPPIVVPPVTPPTPPVEPPVGKVKGNNGWGNGDQNAPGNSGPNNNAENDKGERSQRNHGTAKPNKLWLYYPTD